MKKIEFEVIISGAGYVGMSLACLLAKQNLRIAIIDNNDSYKNVNAKSKFPSRIFAIASASMEIFKNIGIADQIMNHAQSINQILIEDCENNENLTFDPKDLNLQNFGFMVDEMHILNSLNEGVKKCKNIAIYAKHEITQVVNHPYNIEIKFSNNKTLTSKLLIVAEGKNSKTRDLVGIKTKQTGYKQDAIVFDLKHEFNHQGIAVEKFLKAGPFAILPKRGGHESCIVWTDKNGVGKILASMSKDDVAYMIKSKLDNYLGDIEVTSDIIYFPLSLVYAKSYIKDKTILCGDAMHSIHPIAGQGLNLGLRDVQLLDELIKENIGLGLDICSNNLLNQYNKKREFDVNLMINSTHNINQIFSSNLISAKILRKAGLKIINNFTPLKKYIMGYASGYKN
ncbi:MAG: FAD-dependent monooxygenase [Candidatus Midichloriaceae bacterium]